MTVMTPSMRRSHIAKAGPRVLFVDDDQVIRDLAMRGLHRLGVELTLASNVHEAKEMISHVAGQWDVIVVDVRSPVPEGIEFIRWFRTNSADDQTRIVAYTADSELMDEVVLAGANAVLLKPLQWREFVRQLQLQSCVLA
ncbi:MAG: response regulator [Planctomycetales bacterium]|nr:response regulator [Planctomycetales bacterium]